MSEAFGCCAERDTHSLCIVSPMFGRRIDRWIIPNAHTIYSPTVFSVITPDKVEASYNADLSEAALFSGLLCFLWGLFVVATLDVDGPARICPRKAPNAGDEGGVCMETAGLHWKSNDDLSPWTETLQRYSASRMPVPKQEKHERAVAFIKGRCSRREGQ